LRTTELGTTAFREKLPPFREKLPAFLEKLPPFLEKLPPLLMPELLAKPALLLWACPPLPPPPPPLPRASAGVTNAAAARITAAPVANKARFMFVLHTQLRCIGSTTHQLRHWFR
jgi:hypothetical protein